MEISRVLSSGSLFSKQPQQGEIFCKYNSSLILERCHKYMHSDPLIAAVDSFGAASAPPLSPPASPGRSGTQEVAGTWALSIDSFEERRDAKEKKNYYVSLIFKAYIILWHPVLIFRIAVLVLQAYKISVSHGKHSWLVHKRFQEFYDLKCLVNKYLHFIL